MMDEEAPGYERERGHGTGSPEEAEAWRADILENVQIHPSSTCLDEAAGTGVLTRLLAPWVGPAGHVVATDLSEQMLAQNRKLMPPDLQGRVSFFVGDAHDSTLLDVFSVHAFDYVFCRQSVVLFVDPLAVFRKWYDWMKVGSQVVVLDGLWPRSSWSGDWSGLVDRCPLSCVQSLATVPYFLQQVGFVIEKSQLMTRVNNWFTNTQTGNPDALRYMVIARKE